MSHTLPHDVTSSDTGDSPASTEQKAGSMGGVWRSFLLRRISGLVINLVLLVLVTFFIVQLIPGDPATTIAGENATLEKVEQVRAELGLNDPIIVQLVHYVGNVLQGDFGNSYLYKVPALDIVLTAAPYTLFIASIAVLLVLIVGMALGIGIGIATRGDRRRWLDVAFNVLTGFVSSIPAYIQGTLLVLVFAIWLVWLPPAYTMAYGFGESAILPIAALSIGGIASVARIVRRETAVIQEMDYMRTARGWRLPKFVIYAKHMLPNLLTTALTLAGIILTALLGSALIVESVFGWPGLGGVVVQAIAADKDYPVIRAAVFVIGLISLTITLLIDIILGLIDPRTLGASRG
ncbi:MAG: transporter permease [Glaciihabitans sp.]|nr:transporter permease [Glaciihabitans sp.]